MPRELDQRKPLPLWAGRSMALLGILLVALNLRTATTSLSPIADAVGSDIPLGSLQLALVGMVPPIAFALSGMFGAIGARRFGLERFQVISIFAMVLGLAIRAVSAQYSSLLVGTIVALLGAGIGNILLPPLVKRYFPDRIGLVTSLYATLLAVSTGAPAAFAVPLADAGGWRTSMAVWSVLALISLGPWVAILAQHRREAGRLRARVDLVAPDTSELEIPIPEVLGRIWHSRTAWIVALVFSVSSFHAYANFAWLPLLLRDTAGVSTSGAGALLSLFAFMGIPASLIVPALAVRMRNVGWIVQLGVAGFLMGYLGLLVAPAVAPVLWVSLTGVGQVLFPACLVLINLRSRTHEGAVALSGFAQSVSYTIAAIGPLAVGVLHEITGTWASALWLLMAVAAACIPLGIMLRVPRFIEDDISHRKASN